MATKKTGLAKLSEAALLKKAASAWKVAQKHAETAMNAVRRSVLAAIKSGEHLAEWKRRVPSGDWQDRLKAEYCIPHQIAYRSAVRCIQIASADREKLLQHLPPMAGINRAASIAGQLNRGETPAEEVPEEGVPEADDTEVPHLSAALPPETPGHTEKQRQKVRDFIQSALADVKLKASMPSILAFLEKINVGEDVLVELNIDVFKED